MRLGPFTFGARAAAEPTPAEDQPRVDDEKGRSGVINLKGYLQELEYNRDLTGDRRFTNLEQMRSSDGTVEETLGHIAAPIKDATWDIEPASQDPDDLTVAEFVRSAFFRWPAQPFVEYLDQALDSLVFGFMPFETAWTVVEDELIVEAPDEEPRTIPARQYVCWAGFSQRLPRTIVRWNTDDLERLVSVTQNVWKGDGWQQVDIPVEDLVLHVHRRRGGDFTGRSILRAAYKHWRMKELIEKIEVVALERFGVGIPVAYPSNAAAGDDAILDKLGTILENLRSGSRTYVVMPGPKGQSAAAGQDGYVLEILSPSGTPPDFENAKQYHRDEIKGSMLTRFSALGHGQTGARATGDTQAEVWKRALKAYARTLGEAHDPLIKRAVDANFTGVTRYPTLVAHDIESRSLAEFADAHYKLLSGGAIRPDRSYLRSVREATGMPPEDDPDALDQIEQAGRDAAQQALEDGPQHNPPSSDQPQSQQ